MNKHLLYLPAIVYFPSLRGSVCFELHLSLDAALVCTKLTAWGLTLVHHFSLNHALKFLLVPGAQLPSLRRSCEALVWKAPAPFWVDACTSVRHKSRCQVGAAVVVVTVVVVTVVVVAVVVVTVVVVAVVIAAAATQQREKAAFLERRKNENTLFVFCSYRPSLSRKVSFVQLFFLKCLTTEESWLQS